MAAKWAREVSWRPLGGLLEPLKGLVGQVEASSGLWDALGRLWDALGAEKSSLERLLAAPRGIPRQVSAILGAKRVPKGYPKVLQNEVQKQFELKMAKS